MKHFILALLLSLALFSCKEEKKFVPNPKYTESQSVYMKPDSTLGYIKFTAVLVGDKDTNYFYGIEYKDNLGVYHRKIIKEIDIFGQK